VEAGTTFEEASQIGAGSEAAAAITPLRAFRQDITMIAVQAKDAPAAYNSWRKKEICHAPNATFVGGFATGKAYELPLRSIRMA
jgi:threonine dehydratase